MREGGGGGWRKKCDEKWKCQKYCEEINHVNRAITVLAALVVAIGPPKFTTSIGKLNVCASRSHHGISDIFQSGLDFYHSTRLFFLRRLLDVDLTFVRS